MAFRTIPGTQIEYGLISFDTNGVERHEGGRLFSDVLIKKAADEKVTNVFFFCHGWKGDKPEAEAQYDKWMKAFCDAQEHQLASQVFPNFRPLLIGLHWPSLPWGDEELQGGESFAAGGKAGPGALLQTYLERLGDRPEIREPLKIIIEEARRNSSPDSLPPDVRKAYIDLDAALGLGSGGVSAPPDADREGFDPAVSFEAAKEEGADFAGFSLGTLLSPLRQLSYWTMKKRARTAGEGGMHDFLVKLQRATEAAKTRIHLMGHSFGTIVVSGMLGGPDSNGTLARPVDSVALIQGAVSLWCYASSIPFSGAGPGYFNRILKNKKVLGPLITTQSRFDKAVGVFYPLASRVSGSASFAPGQLPEFGAIGRFGLQGLSDAPSDMEMLPATGNYNFDRGKVYNLESSKFIAKGEGASGAHSDIAGPEVAHVIWQGTFASAK